MSEFRALPVAMTFLVVLASSLSGCAASQARPAEVERHAQRTALVLAQRTDADSLAAAGLLSRGGILSEDRHPVRSVALLAQAAAAAPDRPDLAWLHAQVCQEAPPCEGEPLERRLRALDPSNGAGWMGALARADSAGDIAAVNAALLAMSTSDRVDIYWTSLVAHLSRAAARAGTMPLHEAGTMIIGYLAAEGIPAYGAVSRACKGARLQEPQIVEMCRGTAKALERGDTYMTEMIGIAIAKRVWPEDSPQYKAAVEARRVYEYRADKFLKSDLAGSKRPEWAAERYITLCEQNHREQDVSRAQLTEAGENPEPPTPRG